jgi:SEC-C motif-containing protein
MVASRISPNDPCPCGRPAKLKRCCGAYHRGRPAPDPESLMRARYCAYARGDAAYIVATTHPDAPHFREDGSAWRAEIKAYCRQTEFVGLRVEAVDAPVGAETAHVTFTADLQQDGRAVQLHERSRFARHDGRWKYVTAES